MKKMIFVFLILIILIVLSGGCLFYINTIGKTPTIITNKNFSNECKNLNGTAYSKAIDNKIYNKIGVPECCFVVALIVDTEGYYSSEVPPECSGEVMDKIYKYCEKDNSCWE